VRTFIIAASARVSEKEFFKTFMIKIDGEMAIVENCFISRRSDERWDEDYRGN
jgi:hypothetical protein